MGLGGQRVRGLDRLCACNHLAKCRYALGMQDRTIPDGDISASSSWSDSTAARHSRYLAHWGCPGGNSWGFYLPFQPLSQVKRLLKGPMPRKPRGPGEAGFKYLSQRQT